MGALGSMHLKYSIAHGDHFVAVDGQSWSVLITVHRDGQFGVIRELFGSDLKIAAIDNDVLSVEGTLVRLVYFRCEDERAHDGDER